jgi:hypothetical protein
VAAARVCGHVYSDELPVEATRDPLCAATGADGRYRLGDLLPARYELHASAPGFVPGQYRVETKGHSDEGGLRLAAGEARRGIDVVLGAGGVEVSGIVKDIGGGPVEGAWVHVRAGRRWRTGRVSERGEGPAAFRAWVAPGQIHATAGADGWLRAGATRSRPASSWRSSDPRRCSPGASREGRRRTGAARACRSAAGTAARRAAGERDDRRGQSVGSPGCHGAGKPTAQAPGWYGQAAESVLLGSQPDRRDVVIGSTAPNRSPRGWCSATARRVPGRLGDVADEQPATARAARSRRQARRDEAALPGTTRSVRTATSPSAVPDVVSGAPPPEQF